MNDPQVLTRYKAWADDVFLSAIASVPPVDLVAPHPIVFGSLIRTLHHAYAMDHAWRCHLLGTPHGLSSRNPDDCPPFDALAASQRKIDQWYIEYTHSVSDKELEDIVEFEFIGGGRGAMSRRDILLHVVNHTTYHRGQAAGILYQLGFFPPATDLPVFLREHSVVAWQASRRTGPPSPDARQE